MISLLEAVLNSISDGVLVVDGDGEFVLINPAARFILDTDAVPAAPGEWQGAFGIFAADGTTPVAEADMPLVRALNGENPEQDDYVFRNGRNPDGAHVTASARLLDPAAGVRGGGAVAVIRDVTAARLLQEEIRAERDRHESLLAVLSDLGEGVIIADDRQIVFVNDAYCALTGYSVDQLVRQTPDLVSVDPDSLEDFRGWRRALAAHPGSPATMLTRIRHRDGRVLPVETTGIEVTDRGRTRRVSVSRDLSEGHRLQAELSERATALAAANRELASANAALAVARDLATAANRAKSGFLATMSHEIRTPLNAVIGLTDIVLETDLGAVQRGYLETVRDSGDTLMGLINDVLDWSKIESGALDLEHRPFNLRDCVESAVDVLGAQPGNKDVDLLVEVEPGTPAFVVGDQTRLRQILVNLIGNALKFTPEGHVLVTASAAPEPSPDSGKLAVRFSVTDTGVGIPPEKLHRLFQDFSQVDESTTRTHGGTGLGLAISQRLAHAMGGAVTVSSVPGVGSTFTVDVQLTGASPEEVPLPTVAPGVLPGKRALVVDDNADNLRILAAQLAGWGLLVDLASSGPEALTLLSDGARYDVGLIDFQLPGMDGLVLLGEAAGLPGGEGLPVVMLTSVSNRVAVMAADHPPTRHLTKPVHAAELRDALADVLGHSPPTPRRPVAEPDVVESPLRVLLVEDSLVNRTVAQLMLARIGFSVDVAVNGLAAVEALARTPYDVVFMDVRMPVMDGLEATRRLRLDPPPGPRPWIIALTASALQEDRVECAAAGMDDYLSKPIRREQLAGALSRAVR